LGPLDAPGAIGYLCKLRTPGGSAILNMSTVGAPVQLTELLSPGRIKIPLVSATKDEILGELVEVAGSNAAVRDPGEVLRAVREREEVLSTGIGNGVAIPHGKSSGITDLVLVAGVRPEGIDFEALDGKPVNLFFLLVGPEAAAGQHVKALSRISRLLRRDSFRIRLGEATSAEEFYQIIAEAEAT
jgi:mannitol/fructose-specific phosphotransferase system IIA component (Ntr-type)